MLDKSKSTINRRIARRVRELRAASGLSLDALASRTGVSRSMISVIERGESSPTAVVLEKLAAGLGVMLAALFEAHRGKASPVARFKDQPQWRDPASGYIRRNVSPSGLSSPTHIVEVRFPTGSGIAYESSQHNPRLDEQVWVLEGAIDVTVGSDHHRLHTGDCLALELDRPVAFHNPTRKAARYAVVLTPRPGTKG